MDLLTLHTELKQGGLSGRLPVDVLGTVVRTTTPATIWRQSFGSLVFLDKVTNATAAQDSGNAMKAIMLQCDMILDLFLDPLGSQDLTGVNAREK